MARNALIRYKKSFCDGSFGSLPAVQADAAAAGSCFVSPHQSTIEASCDEIVRFTSRHVTLGPGDLIFTGTMGRWRVAHLFRDGGATIKGWVGGCPIHHGEVKRSRMGGVSMMNRDQPNSRG